MDFELSEDQKLLQEMVKDFVEEQVLPQRKSWEDSHQFPHEILKKMGQLGLLGMTVPPEYQGNKTDYLSLILAIEEISKASPSLAVILSVHSSLFCYSIDKFGTTNQKEKYLPSSAKGEKIGAFSLSEPGAGSDATNLKTKAYKKGNSYILNGTKAWVTSASGADTFIIFTAAGEEEGKKRLNAFIVEKDFPGIKVSKVEEKMGLHASGTSEIILEDCEVPEENLLGEEGKGASIALYCLDGSRIGVAAQAVGISQKALEEATAYAKQREAFGKKIAEFQAIQFMLADMATLLDSARFLTYRAAVLHDKNKSFTKEASMAKLFASEAAKQVVDKALQIHGGYGYSKDFFIEQLYRDVRVLSLYEGTSEIQRLVISRHLLKEY